MPTLLCWHCWWNQFNLAFSSSFLFYVIYFFFLVGALRVCKRNCYYMSKFVPACFWRFPFPSHRIIQRAKSYSLPRRSCSSFCSRHQLLGIEINSRVKQICCSFLVHLHLLPLLLLSRVFLISIRRCFPDDFHPAICLFQLRDLTFKNICSSAISCNGVWLGWWKRLKWSWARECVVDANWRRVAEISNASGNIWRGATPLDFNGWFRIVLMK